MRVIFLHIMTREALCKLPPYLGRERDHRATEGERETERETEPEWEEGKEGVQRQGTRSISSSDFMCELSLKVKKDTSPL